MTEYKNAKPGTLRHASVAVMRTMEGQPAAAVIAAIAALPGFDTGKARSHYYWCGQNGFGPYVPQKGAPAAPAPRTPEQIREEIARLQTELNYQGWDGDREAA